MVLVPWVLRVREIDKPTAQMRCRSGGFSAVLGPGAARNLVRPWARPITIAVRKSGVFGDRPPAKPVLLDVVNGCVVGIGDGLSTDGAGWIGLKELLLERSGEDPWLLRVRRKDGIECRTPLVEAEMNHLRCACREFNRVDEILILCHQYNKGLADGVEIGHDLILIATGE